jgi:hypothetical protein
VTIKPKEGHAYHICLAYILGTTSADDFCDYINTLDDRINELGVDNVILLGDFNIPSFTKSEQSPGDKTKSDALKEFSLISGLTQFNTHQNLTTGNILDLVFSNKFLDVKLCADPVTKVDPHHPPLTIKFHLNIFKSPKVKIEFRNYKQANWKHFNSSLLEVDWIRIIDPACDVNGYVKTFYEIINKKLDEFCPIITKFRNENEPRWISRNSKRLKRKQREAHNKWKKTRGKDDLDKYKDISHQLKDSVNADHVAHHVSVEKDLRSNPKKFWTYVKEKKSNGIGIADFLQLDDEIAEDKENAAKLFSKHFSSTLNSNAHDTQDIETASNSIGSWKSHIIDLHEVCEKLSKINVKLSAGPDKLPSSLFKNCATSLTFPLCHIYNKSLRTSKFPDAWKNVFVSPIHKKGSMNEIRNYRPVSKASIVAKIFDALIAEELSTRFRHALPEEQHGFIKKRSTITNLITHTEALQKSVGSKRQRDVIYFDFSSAFDKVPHSRLIAKLKSLGISGQMLEWLHSFLKNRTQQVKIDDVLSEKVPVTSSVIQGSHIGPILFCLYISDISNVLDVEFSLYADDIKISHEIESTEDCEKLQVNINYLIQYAKLNGLTLNTSKCSAVSFSLKKSTAINFVYKINQEDIVREEEFKDLGVIFDKRMNFGRHIDTICSKARQMYGFIMRNSKDFKSPSTAVVLFKSLSRSILEYGTVIWSPYHASRINQIEAVQHIFIRSIARRYFNHTSYDIDYKFYEDKLKLQPLRLRRIINDVAFILKSFNGSVESQTFLHHFNFHIRLPRETRQKIIFEPNYATNETASKSVFNRLMTTFNKYIDDYDALTEGKKISAGLVSSITEIFNHEESP